MLVTDHLKDVCMPRENCNVAALSSGNDSSQGNNDEVTQAETEHRQCSSDHGGNNGQAFGHGAYGRRGSGQQ